MDELINQVFGVPGLEMFNQLNDGCEMSFFDKQLPRLRVIHSFFAILLVLICSVLNSQEVSAISEPVPLIPRETFFAQAPEDIAVKISPNGKQISFLKTYEGVLNIWTQNIDDKQKASPVTKSKDSIFRYYWAKNNEQILFYRDFNGDENSHIYSLRSWRL